MFAGTEKRKFHCGRCKRKEQRRKFYWGEILEIPVTAWPTRYQNGDALVCEAEHGGRSSGNESRSPSDGRKHRLSSLGLFDEEKGSLQYTGTGTCNKIKKQRSKQKRKKREARSVSNVRKSRRRRSKTPDSTWQFLESFTDEETNNSPSSSGSDWSSTSRPPSGEKSAHPWWKPGHGNRCQRCSNHHAAHKKWEAIKRPNSENLQQHAEEILAKRLSAKEGAPLISAVTTSTAQIGEGLGAGAPASDQVGKADYESVRKNLRFENWWENQGNCEVCRKHHERASILETFPLNAHGQLQKGPASGLLDAGRVAAIGGPESLKMKAEDGGLPAVHISPKSNLPQVKDSPTSRHGANVLSPSERFANKWKEKNLSLRWWEPEMRCLNCLKHHHLDDPSVKMNVFGEELEGDGKGHCALLADNILKDLNIYLPRDASAVSKNIRENDAQIMSGLKRINTSRESRVKFTLPCSLHSKQIMEESIKRAKETVLEAAAIRRQDNEAPRWWEDGRDDCKNCFEHHETAHQRERFENGSPRRGPVQWNKSRTKDAASAKDQSSSRIMNRTGKLGKRSKKNEGGKTLLSTRSRPVGLSSTSICGVIIQKDKGDAHAGTDPADSSFCPASRDSHRKNEMRNINCDKILGGFWDSAQEMPGSLSTHSRSCPNINLTRDFEDQKVYPVTSHDHTDIRPKVLLPPAAVTTAQKGGHPWPELQPPFIRADSHQLRANDMEEETRQIMIQTKERIRRLEAVLPSSQKAHEKVLRAAMNRAPRVAPVVCIPREAESRKVSVRYGYNNEKGSRSSSPLLHENDFNVVDSRPDRPLAVQTQSFTILNKRDRNSPSSEDSQKRRYLTRRPRYRVSTKQGPKKVTEALDQSIAENSRDPSKHLQRNLCTSDHELKLIKRMPSPAGIPPPIDYMHNDNRSPSSRHNPPNWELENTSERREDNDLSPQGVEEFLTNGTVMSGSQVEGAPLSTWLANLVNAEKRILGEEYKVAGPIEDSKSPAGCLVPNSILSIALNLMIEGLLLKTCRPPDRP